MLPTIPPPKFFRRDLLSRAFRLQLPATDKLVLCCMAWRAQRDGSQIRVTQDAIAVTCGMSDRSVRDAIKRLLALGILVKVHGPIARRGWAPEYRLDMRLLPEESNAKQILLPEISARLPENSSGNAWVSPENFATKKGTEKEIKESAPASSRGLRPANDNFSRRRYAPAEPELDMAERERNQWIARATMLKASGGWSDMWGEKPGHPRCRMPIDLQREVLASLARHAG